MPTLCDYKWNQASLHSICYEFSWKLIPLFTVSTRSTTTHTFNNDAHVICEFVQYLFSLPLISSGRAFAVRTACTFSGVPEKKGMVERGKKEGRGRDRGDGGRRGGGRDRGKYYKSLLAIYQHSVLLLQPFLLLFVILCLLQIMSALF